MYFGEFLQKKFDRERSLEAISSNYYGGPFRRSASTPSDLGGENGKKSRRAIWEKLSRPIPVLYKRFKVEEHLNELSELFLQDHRDIKKKDRFLHPEEVKQSNNKNSNGWNFSRVDWTEYFENKRASLTIQELGSKMRGKERPNFVCSQVDAYGNLRLVSNDQWIKLPDGQTLPPNYMLKKIRCPKIDAQVSHSPDILTALEDALPPQVNYSGVEGYTVGPGSLENHTSSTSAEGGNYDTGKNATVDLNKLIVPPGYYRNGRGMTAGKKACSKL